ncbi:sortase domain-bontaining protein [Aeromicrobium sp. Leaf350]|uniref:sortase domain-containing protein n=1 Tax=Aeromicrobium sp. Leaf350 TaxID=2876565 RepID=UPI001E477555|nr:sortase [Aeromicrobium sp. Leaf350]
MSVSSTRPSLRRHLLLTLALTALASLGVDDLGADVPATPPIAAPAPVDMPEPKPGLADPLPGGDPLAVRIDAIGVDVPLGAVGLKPDGAMQTPATGHAAWYSPGPRPGERGGAVLVAHVAGRGGPDVFWRLGELRPGDVVSVQHTAGTSTFVVDHVTQTPKEALPVERIWGDTRRPLLRLITCGGTRSPQTGRYPDNTVVYAHLV